MITNRETYMIMGDEHTKGDELVTDETVRATQQMINGHIAMVIKAFKIGEYWGQVERMRESTINDSEEISPMYLVV